MVDRSTYVTDDGAWIIPTRAPYFSPLADRDDSPSPDFISVNENFLIWDDDRIGVKMGLDEHKVREIKAKFVKPLLAKLIKKLKGSRKEIVALHKRVKHLKKQFGVEEGEL